MTISSPTQRFQKNLNGGLIALVLLGVLERSARDLYGYEIAKGLADVNGIGSRFGDGSIYPVLRALAHEGLLTSRIVPSYSGPPRRYYGITDAGRALLPQWRKAWQETRDFVERFVTTSAEAP